MTSEVALLNKTAVALAADSATTVTYWENGKEHTRYYKGANKIFNISTCRPVGLMTFASASLQGVPWEILAKAFRDDLRDRGHDTLEEYANAFFDFIRNNHLLYPKEVQDSQFVALADRAATRAVFAVLATPACKAETDDNKKPAIVETELRAHAAKVKAAALLGDVVASDVSSAQTAFQKPVLEMIEKDTFFNKWVPRSAWPELASIGIEAVFREDHSPLDNTGLVIAGYGEKEFFPHLFRYSCHGLVNGKLILAKAEAITISQENAADYVHVAKTEMIETFIYGANIRTMVLLDRTFEKYCADFEQKVRALPGVSLPGDLSTELKNAKTGFASELMDYFKKTHQWPLRRVIGMLPISELAELAETLVYMESMKERVTSPAESVSGPIDVAVISKSDGFIWLKRKHYFDTALNPRYEQRLHKR